MSKIGNRFIKVPDQVKIDLDDRSIVASGPLGSKSFPIPRDIEVKMENNEIKVSRKAQTIQAKANHGLTRAMIANLVTGVNTGFTKKLIFSGVGYKAQVTPDGSLELNVGYSHPVIIKPVEEISIAVAKNEITVSGNDKQRVGQMAAEIRKVRKPEPYKGKGIRYSDEVIKRKAGKTVKASS